MTTSNLLVSQQAIAAIHKLEPDVLQRGDNSEAVQFLQKALAELHLFNGSVDGFYGTKTINSIRRVQRYLGLEDTGVFDYETWYGMNFWSDDLVIDPPSDSSQRFWSPFKKVTKLFGG